MTRGDVLNKPFVSSRQVLDCADNVSIGAGSLVYQDTTNGMKVVPTTSQPQASRIWFLEKAVDNTVTGHAKGFVAGEVYKQGALVVGKADGTITPGAYCRASTNEAGSFQIMAIPADLTGGESPTEAEHILVLEFLRRAVAIYQGHLGEGKQIGNDPTDAADDDVNCVFRML